MKKEKIEALVAAAQRKEPKSMDQLIEGCYSDIYNYALSIVKNEDAAADITQNACLRIVKNLCNLNTPCAFVSWVRHIVYNLCAMYFRKRRELPVDCDEDGASVLDGIADNSEDVHPDKAYANTESKQIILDMIKSLPPEQASALILHYYEEKSVSEIAALQGVAEGTVKSRLNYGRRSMRAKIEDYQNKTGTFFDMEVPSAFSLFNLNRVTVPTGTSVIADGEFCKDENIQAISLPNSLKSIGNAAFAHCSMLSYAIIPHRVEQIGDYAFYNCSSLIELDIPSSTTHIGIAAFSGCRSLLKVNLPWNISNISNWIFSGCEALKKLEIPYGVTEIGDGAFENCTSLTKIKIPSSITSIGRGAFRNCSAMNTIYYGGTKAEWLSIQKPSDWLSEWDEGTGSYTILCTDGKIK